MSRAVMDHEGRVVLCCPRCRAIVGVSSAGELRIGNVGFSRVVTLECRSPGCGEQITWRPGEAKALAKV